MSAATAWIFADDRQRRAIAVAAGLLGALVVLFWVGSFGVNVPIADDWDHVSTSVRWHDHGIDATSLLIPHNEHCLAIPKLVSHAILKASGGNYRAVLFLNAALAIVTLVIVLAFVSHSPLQPPALAVVAAAIAALMSAWCQWQNWIWAFQTPWFLLPLILVAAAVTIARTRSIRLAVAATAAATVLGPLCMANGILVGWALLPALALRLADEPRGRRWQPFSIAAGVIILATALGLVIASRAHGPQLGGIAAVCAAPLDAVRLLFAVVGSPLDPRGAFHGHKTMSVVAGGVSLAVGVAAVVAGLRTARARSGRDLGPGFALMVYGLASVGAVVVGRLSLLASEPVESRYHAFAIAWHVGVLLTCAWLAVEQADWAGRAWRMVLVAASFACLVATFTGLNFFLRHGANMRRALEEHQSIYRGAQEPGGREKLTGIARHYGADGILERLEGMRRAGIVHADYAPAAPNEGEVK